MFHTQSGGVMMSNKLKFTIRLAIGIIGISLMALTIYSLFFLKQVTETAKEIHVPMERQVSEKREEPIVFQKKDPFSVLLLGVDERDGDRGRSDTMIVLTVNPTLKSTKMLSIPRDTYTLIVGKNIEDKLNHAYAYGGIEMSLNSVEHLLDLPIDYVVQVNMESFQQIINALDGITVENTMAFSEEGFSFPKGLIQMNGEEALAYVRMRYHDPRGDFGRQDRQKEVIQAVLRRSASLNSLLNVKEIFDAIKTNVRTNMTLDDMIDIQKNYREAAKDVEQLMLTQGHGKWIDGIWYYVVDDEELAHVSNDLRLHLSIEKERGSE